MLNIKEEKNGSISQIGPGLYKKLHCSNATPASFYGLPKIHKPERPLRPITSSIGSPTYAVSKHLVSILSPLRRNRFSVKNSSEFAQKIQQRTVASDETIDFKPLRTVNSLFPQPKAQEKDDRPQFGTVYKITCNNCSFVYYGQTERPLKTRIAEHKRAVSMFHHDSKIFSVPCPGKQSYVLYVLQVNKQAQKCLLALVTIQNFVLKRVKTVWLIYQSIKQWPVRATCGMWPVKETCLHRLPQTQTNPKTNWKLKTRNCPTEWP